MAMLTATKMHINEIHLSIVEDHRSLFLGSKNTNQPLLHVFNSCCLHDKPFSLAMAQTRVLIKYGPYRSFTGVEHKTDRIKGLETYLTNLGYSVQNQAIPVRNVCEVHVYDLKVFECDIRQLQFGGDGELDDLCHQAHRKITHVTSPSA